MLGREPTVTEESWKKDHDARSCVGQVSGALDKPSPRGPHYVLTLCVVVVVAYRILRIDIYTLLLRRVA